MICALSFTYDPATRRLDGPRGWVEVTPSTGRVFALLLETAGAPVARHALHAALDGEDRGDLTPDALLARILPTVRRLIEAVTSSRVLLTAHDGGRLMLHAPAAGKPPAPRRRAGARPERAGQQFPPFRGAA